MFHWTLSSAVTEKTGGWFMSVSDDETHNNAVSHNRLQTADIVFYADISPVGPLCDSPHLYLTVQTKAVTCEGVFITAMFTAWTRMKGHSGRNSVCVD